MSTGQIIFTSIVGTAALMAIAFVIFEQWRTIDDLKKQMGIYNGATKRIKKHNGYNENCALEDAISLLLQDEVVDEMESNAKRARRETAVAILLALRHDPRKYTPDKSIEDYLKERSNL